eukprot:249147-Chlamydomonas_euryale.AAC.1
MLDARCAAQFRRGHRAASASLQQPPRKRVELLLDAGLATLPVRLVRQDVADARRVGQGAAAVEEAVPNSGVEVWSPHPGRDMRWGAGGQGVRVQTGVSSRASSFRPCVATSHTSGASQTFLGSYSIEGRAVRTPRTNAHTPAKSPRCGLTARPRMPFACSVEPLCVIPSMARRAAVPQGTMHVVPRIFHRALSISAAARKRRGWGDWRLASSLALSCQLLS